MRERVPVANNYFRPPTRRRSRESPTRNRSRKAEKTKPIWLISHRNVETKNTTHTTDFEHNAQMLLNSSTKHEFNIEILHLLHFREKSVRERERKDQDQ